MELERFFICLCFNFIIQLHYSYMELEHFFYLRYFFSCHLLHYSYMELEHVILLLIDSNKELHYSYMELEPIISDSFNSLSLSITLFLYGIGANVDNWACPDAIKYYIIPIWNWSMHYCISF